MIRNNILLICCAVVGAYKFPPEFERCHMSDPQLDACLDKTLQMAFRAIGNKGFPSLGLPSVDPLQVKYMEIGAGTSAVHLVQRYSDVNFIGISKGNVVNSHFDKEKKILKFSIKSPEFRHQAQYNVTGKILVIPTYGAGDSVVRLEDAHLDSTIKFEEEMRNGKKYFKVSSYDALLDAEKIHYDFQNLFDGNKELGDNLLNVLNENYRKVYDDVKWGVSKSYAEVGKSIANTFFQKFPVDEIFLP